MNTATVNTFNFENDQLAELQGANRTLLLPLWARAKENQQPTPLLVDKRAAQIIASLEAMHGHRDDFKEMERIFDRYLQLSQLIRAACIDDEIRFFLEKHPQATIVNIGAGLDTTFDRVDNGQMVWYDLDLPEVIAIRHQYIPEAPRSRCIASSVLDSSWFDEIGEPQNGLMFVACGVLFFLDENQAKKLFLELADQFPGSEFVFDTMAGLFMRIANRSVLKRSGMGSQAVMRWAVHSAREIVKWDDRIRMVAEYPMYSQRARNPSWGKSVLFRMEMANRMHAINIFHLKFGE